MAGDSDAPGSAPTVAATADTEATTAPRAPSRLSLSDYEIDKPLGRGGMGEVLLAKDAGIGREIAIKRLIVDDPEPEAVARFMREAKIQAQLEHPAIVPVHQIGHDAAGRPFFTMKRLAGRTLLEVLRDGTVRQQRLLRALVDVCNAIDLAHSRGVVHRDLKPANIMLGDFGEVYVLDWGIARVIGGADGASSPGLPASGETQVGALLGTLGYMAPEQLGDASTAGPAADVYALGCILFEILAGVPVHPRGADAMTSTLRDEPHSPAARAPARDVPPELDVACTAALAFEATRRPAARALAERIEAYLDGDRDLEHRRTLAAEHVAKASAAIGDPSKRAEATREAGRAIALDPASPAAAALVNRLVFELPDVMPPDLSERLDEVDQASSRRAAGSASVMMYAFLLAVPLFLWSGIASWPWLIGLSAATVALSIIARLQSRARRTNEWFALVGVITLCVLLSRFVGVFVVVPMVVMISMFGLGQQATFIEHPIALACGALAPFVVPLVLEATGVWAPTFAIRDGHVVLSSAVLRLDGTAAFLCLLVPHLVLAIVAGWFGRTLGGMRRKALHDLEIRDWHMQRMIGLGTSG